MASKKQTKFGQIPFWAICLFSERSKLEIAVFSYICSQRFGSPESNCSRQEIMEYTGLHKSQVSSALNDLIFIKWVKSEGKDRWSVPESAPEKVHESRTKSKKKVHESSTNLENKSSRIVNKSSQNVNKKFTNQEQKVHESSTPSYKDSDSSYSSDFSDVGETSSQTARKQKSVGKKKSEADPRSKHPAIQVIRGLNGQYPKKILWDDLIARLGDDFDGNRLAACCKEWNRRGYNPQAVTWVDWYFDGIPERKGNGTKPTTNQAGESTADALRRVGVRNRA